MTSVTVLPFGRPLTRHDLETMPDDGHRYELIDGTLIVSPAPSRRHQSVQINLVERLLRACPADLQVLVAPVDVAMAEDTVIQPDILVVDRAAFRDLERDVMPLLAVEVASPSTRLIDLNLKKARLERYGCTSYWIVDPGLDDGPPSITAWELRAGIYAEVTRAEADERFAVQAPYALELTPGELAS